MFNLFKKSPPIDTTQVRAALARVVHPEQRRDLGHSDSISSRKRMDTRRDSINGGECQRKILVKISINDE